MEKQLQNMDLELRIAVEFLLSFVVKKFKDIDTKNFVEVLIKTLSEKFQGHWYPDQPSKGSAYRCISLNDQLDNVLIRSAAESGFDLDLLKSSLPLRLNVWIDPKEISYRIGKYLTLNFTITSFTFINKTFGLFPQILSNSLHNPFNLLFIIHYLMTFPVFSM